MCNVYRVPFNDRGPCGPVESLPGVRSDRPGWLIDARGSGDYDYGDGLVLIAADSAAEALALAVGADDYLEVYPGTVGDAFLQ